MDAGHLANTQGGFVGKGLRMKGGPIRLRPGEYRPLDVGGAAIKENLVPVKFDGPNATLFQLLGFLVEAANDISSTKDILSGEQKQSNVPASTTLALIEQGLKTHTAINKRVHRSLKREFRLLYALNGKYMPPQTYITFLDAETPVKVLLDDFKADDFDIMPASDPKILTDMQEIARAEALLPFKDDPDFDGFKIKMRYLQALGIPDTEDLRADPEQKKQQAQLQMQAMMLELKSKAVEVQANQMKAEAALIKAKSGAVKDRTGAVLDLAKAEQENETLQGEVEYYRNVVEQMSQLMEMMYGEQASGSDGGGGVPGVGGPAGTAQFTALPQTQPGQHGPGLG